MNSLPHCVSVSSGHLISVSPFPIVCSHRRSSFLDAWLSLCLLLLLKVQVPITRSLTHSLSLYPFTWYSCQLPFSVIKNALFRIPALFLRHHLFYITSISLPPSLLHSPSLPPTLPRHNPPSLLPSFLLRLTRQKHLSPHAAAAAETSNSNPVLPARAFISLAAPSTPPSPPPFLPPYLPLPPPPPSFCSW